MADLTREQRMRLKIPTIGGRALLVTGTLDHQGQVEAVEIAEAWVDGPKDHRRVVQFPGHVLPELRDALSALLDAEADHG